MLNGKQTGGVPGNPSRRPTPAAPDLAETLRQVRDQLAARLGQKDYLWIGNTALEILLRPGQQEQPDATTRLLDGFMPMVITQFFGIPPDLTYVRPFSDQQVEWTDRGTWEKDRFIELVIHAYMIGASLRRLPRPHDAKLPYYEMYATLQAHSIRSAHYVQHQHLEPPRKATDRRAHAEWNATQDRLYRLSQETSRVSCRAVDRYNRLLACSPDSDPDIATIREEGRKKGWDQSLIDAEIEHLRAERAKRGAQEDPS